LFSLIIFGFGRSAMTTSLCYARLAPETERANETHLWVNPIISARAWRSRCASIHPAQCHLPTPTQPLNRARKKYICLRL